MYGTNEVYIIEMNFNFKYLIKRFTRYHDEEDGESGIYYIVCEARFVCFVR